MYIPYLTTGQNEMIVIDNESFIVVHVCSSFDRMFWTNIMYKW